MNPMPNDQQALFEMRPETQGERLPFPEDALRRRAVVRDLVSNTAVAVSASVGTSETSLEYVNEGPVEMDQDQLVQTIDDMEISRGGEPSVAEARRQVADSYDSDLQREGGY